MFISPLRQNTIQCNYKYIIKTSKNNKKKKETDSTGQTNRQDERVQIQVYKKFKTIHIIQTDVQNKREQFALF